jgi:ferredoxin-like protein FixX
MEAQSLNIHENHKMLAIKALDVSRTIKDAAKLIGICDRTLYRWIETFDIEFDENKMVEKKRN